MKKVLFVLFVLIYITANGQQWTRLADFPGNARFGAVMVYLNGKLYAGLGGNYYDYYNDWYEYDIQNDVWTSKDSLPAEGRVAPAFFSLDNKIFVGCGLYKGSSLLNDFYYFDTETEKWTQTKYFSGGKRYATIHFSANGKGYVGLGENHSATKPNNFWEFDLEQNIWIMKKSFESKVGASIFTIDDSVYMVGGNGDFFLKKDLWRYNAENDKWTKKAEYPGSGIMGNLAFSLNGYGYVGLGVNQSSSSINEFYRYNPFNDLWLHLDSVPFSTRFSMSAVGTPYGAFVAFGNFENVPTKELWKYNTTSSVESENKHLESLFPNPANEYIEINMMNHRVNPMVQGFEIEIYNVLGERVKSIPIPQTIIHTPNPSREGNLEGVIRVDISDLVPGVYFVKVGNLLKRFIKM